MFKMADSEIPIAAKSIVQKAADVFSKFTRGEMDNLIKYVIDEGQALKNILYRDDLGPAVAGVYNKRLNKFYTAINDVSGKEPSNLVQILKDRVDNMPQDIYDSYSQFTKGAGSHAEVYAVNKALLDDPAATMDDLLVYINRTGNMNEPMTQIPFHTCPHCEYILDGFKILSDIL